MNIIELKNLSIKTDGKILLQKLSWQLEVGSKAVIAGASGSGKSSFLRSLVGFYPIAEGEVFIDGMKLNKVNISKIRTRVTFLSQETVLGADTGREAIMLPYTFAANIKRRPSEKALHETLDLVGLPNSILDAQCATLSGGEKQRLAIARGLLMGKKLILADEVTSALDVASRDRVAALFLSLPISILAVSHEPDVIARFENQFTLEDMTLKPNPVKSSTPPPAPGTIAVESATAPSAELANAIANPLETEAVNSDNPKVAR